MEKYNFKVIEKHWQDYWDKNHTFKTILNRSNPNLILVDIDSEKKSIDINQIRKLISNNN